jgi:hypothetical protein
MRAAQTLLGVLYCLSVVLLPYLHFLFDAHGTDVSVSTACSGHAHEHEYPPEEGNPDEHDENCLLCKFLAAANDTPAQAPDLQSGLGMVFLPAASDEFYACTPARAYHARAPPFMTV